MNMVKLKILNQHKYFWALKHAHITYLSVPSFSRKTDSFENTHVVNAPFKVKGNCILVTACRMHGGEWKARDRTLNYSVQLGNCN